MVRWWGWWAPADAANYVVTAGGIRRVCSYVGGHRSSGVCCGEQVWLGGFGWEVEGEEGQFMLLRTKAHAALGNCDMTFRAHSCRRTGTPLLQASEVRLKVKRTCTSCTARLTASRSSPKLSREA